MPKQRILVVNVDGCLFSASNKNQYMLSDTIINYARKTGQQNFAGYVLLSSKSTPFNDQFGDKIYVSQIKKALLSRLTKRELNAKIQELIDQLNPYNLNNIIEQLNQNRKAKSIIAQLNANKNLEDIIKHFNVETGLPHLKDVTPHDFHHHVGDGAEILKKYENGEHPDTALTNLNEGLYRKRTYLLDRVATELAKKHPGQEFELVYVDDSITNCNQASECDKEKNWPANVTMRIYQHPSPKTKPVDETGMRFVYASPMPTSALRQHSHFAVPPNSPATSVDEAELNNNVVRMN